MCGRRGTWYTTLLPAFHPPPTQARSSSIAVPSEMRASTWRRSRSSRGSSYCRAMSANAVGITQLTVSGIQLHPNFAGSNCALLSNARSFNRQSQFASRQRAERSQSRARVSRPESRPSCASVMTASAVAQHPSPSSPANAGQLPSRFCQDSRRATTPPSSCNERVAHAPRARSAKEVGSVASCLAPYPQAPATVRFFHRLSARRFRSTVSPTPHFYALFRAPPKPGLA